MTRSRRIQCAAVVSLLLVIGLVALRAFQSGSGTDKPPSIQIWDETAWQARSEGFDYAKALALAENGDRDAATRLLIFSGHTDAAGACGHSAVLFQLMEKLGDEQFASAIAEVPPKPDLWLAQMLEAGVDYGTDGHWKSIEDIQAKLARDFPKSYAAAKQHGHDCRK